MKKGMKKLAAIVLTLIMVAGSLYVPGNVSYAASKKTVRSVSVKIGNKRAAKKTVQMTKGQSKKLKVSVKPASAKKSVTFRSKNKKIVSVSKSGKLKAKKKGTTKITITVKDKRGRKKTTWVKIKVISKKTVKKDDVPEPEQTITFNSNGGTAVPKQKVKKGGVVQKPADPIKNGYIFGGWYLDWTLTKPYDFSAKVAGSFVLYAKWNPVGDSGEYKVTFVLNDGTAGAFEQQVVSGGSKALRPQTDPTRQLYRFTGWYTEAEAINPYDFSKVVTSDLVLYAGWGAPDKTDDSLYAASSGEETIFSVAGVEVDNGQVKATVNVNQASVLSVEFLNENDESEVYTSVQTQTPDYCEMTPISLPVDKNELPEHYVVRAYLYDEDGEELCDPFTCIKYTTKYEEFDKQTVDDFAEDKVINFDSDRQDNFGVLTDGIKTVEISDDVNVLKVIQEQINTPSEGEDPVYTQKYEFTNPDEMVSALTSGDKVYITASEDSDGQKYLFKAESVEHETDGKIVVTADPEAEMSEFYDVLKVSMGVDVTKEDVRRSTKQTRAEIIDANGTFSKSIGASFEQTFGTGKWLAVKGGLKGTGSVEIEMTYDAKLFKKDYFYCSIVSNLDLKFEIGVEVKADNGEKIKAELEAPRIPLPTPIPGLDLYFEPTLPTEWKITGNGKFEIDYKTKSGFTYDTNSGQQTIDKKEYAYKIYAEGSAEIKVGPKVKLGVSFLKEVVQAEVSTQIGLKASITTNELGGNITNAESKHACGLCLDGEAKWFFTINAKLKLEITEKLSATPIDWDIVSLEGWITFLPAKPGKFYISLINGSDSCFKGKVHFAGGGCPNKTYRTVVEVRDEQDNLLHGSTVTIQKEGSKDSRGGRSTYTTYLYDGTYKVSGNINGKEVSKSFMVNGSAQTVGLNPNSEDGTLTGKVCDETTGNGISEATILLKQKETIIKTVHTDKNGDYSTSVPDGKYRVEVTKDGYLPFTIYETMENGRTQYMETIYMISGDGSKMGGFSGTITDATTADYVEGVTLQLRSGWNNTDDGDVIKTLTTDEDGYFSYDSKKLFHVTFGLKSGNYTLTASKDGYTPMSFNVIVLPETDKGGQDATMSPIMAAEEYRVVLRWGAVPEDLDSHYNALSADGDEEHVYYSEMDSANAHLDVDDRDSYGPETITISGFENLKNGFTYSVHDYTNSDYDDSRELSASGATVQLYVSGKLVRTYHVPTGRVGTVWNVFSVDANGKITDLNTFESVSDPDNVGEQFRK